MKYNKKCFVIYLLGLKKRCSYKNRTKEEVMHNLSAIKDVIYFGLFL
jgi:hypothetical protein